MSSEDDVLKAASVIARIMSGQSYTSFLSEYLELNDPWKNLARIMLQEEDPMEDFDTLLEEAIEDHDERIGFAALVSDQLTALSRSAWEDSRKIDFWTFEDAKDEIKEISWLWKGWIPRGQLTLLVGRPEIGKSAFALYLAGQYVRGADWPDGQQSFKENGKPNEVVWLDQEHNHAQNLNRITTWNIPTKRLIWPRSKIDPKSKTPHMQLHKKMDRQALVDLLDDRRPGFVVIDTLRGAVGNMNENDSEFAAFLYDLAGIARQFNCAILLVHHLRKSGKDQEYHYEITLDDIRGSSAIPAVCRSVIAIDKPNSQLKSVRAIVIKANLIDRSTVNPVGFTLGNNQIVFETAPAPPLNLSAVERCSMYLKARLARGEVSAKTITEDCMAQGYSTRTMNRARTMIGAESKKIGANWIWFLSAEEDQMCLAESEGRNDDDTDTG